MKNTGKTINTGTGATGSIIVRIARWGGMSWIVTLMLFVLLAITLTLNALKTPEVMIVDKNGNFLGYVNFQNSLARTDTEMLNAAKKFSSCQWSLNAATIIEDAACAISMSDTLPYGHKASQRERLLKNLEQSNYIDIVKNANNRSSVSFNANEVRLVGERFAKAILDENGEPIINNGTVLNHYYQRVVVAGDINVLGTQKKIKSFKQELTLRIVPRTSFDHLGVVVSDENNI